MVADGSTRGVIRRNGVGFAVSVGCFVFLGIVLPQFSPAWLAKSYATWFGLQHLGTAKLNKDSLTGLVLAGGYIKQAMSAAEDERDSIRGEREAFGAFADEVESLDVATQQTAGVDARALTAADDADSLQRVRDCYRNTVMDVPDYDREYGEPLAEHLAEEFSDELAAVVLGGSELTPNVRALLVRQARLAADRRDELLKVIDQEYMNLVDNSAQLDEIDATLADPADEELHEQSFPDLVDHDRDLRECETRCRRLLEDRQYEIHQETNPVARSDTPFLQEFLYSRLECTFPVINATLDRIRRLRERRRTLVGVIARRS